MNTIVGDPDLDKLIDGQKVILKFQATWCGPCKTLTPLMDEISTETGIPVFSIDVDENPKLSEKFAINSIPTIITMNGLKPINVRVGLAKKDIYLALINKLKDEI